MGRCPFLREGKVPRPATITQRGRILDNGVTTRPQHCIRVVRFWAGGLCYSGDSCRSINLLTCPWQFCGAVDSAAGARVYD